MGSKATADAIQRTVNSKWSDFKNAFDQVLAAFGNGADGNQRKAKIEAVQTTARNLRDILAEPDRAQWLNAIVGAAQNFVGNPSPDSSRNFLQTALQFFHQVQPVVLIEDAVEYDFDKVFEELRTRHELSDLFDRLVAEISSIIESGELDSATTLNALQKMAAALRANRKGSLSSMMGAFSFVRFGWRFTAEVLQRIPVLKEMVNATEKTLKEGDEKLKRVEQELRDAALTKLVECVPNIQKLSSFADQMLLLTGQKTEAIEGEFEKITDSREAPMGVIDQPPPLPQQVVRSVRFC